MDPIQEFVHQMKNLARQETGADSRLATWGHIASYDPQTHAVKCLLPSYRGLDDAPVMTPWIQLATPWAGKGANSFGMQFAPYGGATASNPENGEQCFIIIVEKQSGASVCAYLLYNDVQPPPTRNSGVTLAAGEMILMHASGMYIKMRSDGLIELNNIGGSSSFAARIGDDVSIPHAALQAILDLRYQLAGGAVPLTDVSGKITSGSSKVKIG